MRYAFFLGTSFFLLTGCSGPRQPIVDTRGVDQVKYSNDMSDCYARRNNGPAIQFGPTVTNCLKDKGYIILSPGE